MGLIKCSGVAIGKLPIGLRFVCVAAVLSMIGSMVVAVMVRGRMVVIVGMDDAGVSAGNHVEHQRSGYNKHHRQPPYGG